MGAGPGQMTKDGSGRAPNTAPGPPTQILGTTDARQTRATIIFLISAIALPGFKPFGQVFAQFIMVWQR